ncbi:MAG: NUDIX domain-containing protein [archaeon]
MKGVKAILVNSEGKLLMQHREDKPGFDFPNTWSLFGGAIDEGETAEEAIVREIKEEIDYDVNDYKFVEEVNFPHLFSISMFIVPIDKELKDLTLREGDDFDFFTKEEVFELKLSDVARKFLEIYYKK